MGITLNRDIMKKLIMLAIFAPGTNIYSTVLGDSIGKDTGTSMAAPHIAGVAALILEINPQLPHNLVRRILAESARKIGSYDYVCDENKEFSDCGWNERYGYGLVDTYQAVLKTIEEYYNYPIFPL